MTIDACIVEESIKRQIRTSEIQGQIAELQSLICLFNKEIGKLKIELEAINDNTTNWDDLYKQIVK